MSGLQNPGIDKRTRYYDVFRINGFASEGDNLQEALTSRFIKDSKVGVWPVGVVGVLFAHVGVGHRLNNGVLGFSAENVADLNVKANDGSGYFLGEFQERWGNDFGNRQLAAGAPVKDLFFNPSK